MEEERFWVLWTKNKTEQLTADEQEELQRLNERMLANGLDAGLAEMLWNSSLEPYPTESIHESIWPRVLQMTTDGSRIPSVPEKIVPAKKMIKRWMVAASLIALVSLAFLFFRLFEPGGSESRMLNKVTTEPDSKSQVELPDGTTVWLNQGSKITYSGDLFGSAQRNVTLTGEAFFDVKRNEAVPFIINTDDIRITVKGTAFNVKAYPGSRTVETALVRGLIEITTRKYGERKILLRPNEKFTLDLAGQASGQVTVTNKDSSAALSYSVTQMKTAPGAEPAETAWMNQRLYFNDERLEDLARRLESWYNVRIVFGSDEIRSKRFTGAIEKESVQEILEVLRLSATFNYSVNGKIVTIQ